MLGRLSLLCTFLRSFEISTESFPYPPKAPSGRGDHKVLWSGYLGLLSLIATRLV